MKDNFYYTHITNKPYVFLCPSVRLSSICTVALLLPQLAALMIMGDYRALAVILTAVVASFLAELLDKLIRHRQKIAVVQPLLTGLLIGMLLPASYPIGAELVLVCVVLLLTRYAFGGIAAMWANQIAIAIVIAFLVGSAWFPTAEITLEQLQNRNPSLQLIQNDTVAISAADTAVTQFLNTVVFKWIGTSIPEGYFSFFWDSGSSIPAFRFNILILFASIVLLALGMIPWLIPLCYLGVYLVLVRLFGSFLVGGVLGQGDMFLALCTGGTLFCAFFVLPWFGTTPQTVCGKVIYGLMSGVLGFLVAGCGMSPIGTVYAILAGNIMAPLIQYFEEKITYKQHVQTLLPLAERLRRFIND